MGQLGPRDQVAAKYRDRAEFRFVYCREAHPGKPFGSLAMSPDAPPDYELTTTWEERAERASVFSKDKQLARPILVDEDDDASVQQLYGGGDNQLIVIGADGCVAFKQLHTDPQALDEFLAGYLPAESPDEP
jgi:hypothetical protein